MIWIFLAFMVGGICGAVCATLMFAAGTADDRIHDMFDYHVEQDEDGNEVLVTVPKGDRGTAV